MEQEDYKTKEQQYQELKRKQQLQYIEKQEKMRLAKGGQVN